MVARRCVYVSISAMDETNRVSATTIASLTVVLPHRVAVYRGTGIYKQLYLTSDVYLFIIFPFSRYVITRPVRKGRLQGIRFNINASEVPYVYFFYFVVN